MPKTGLVVGTKPFGSDIIQHSSVDRDLQRRARGVVRAGLGYTGNRAADRALYDSLTPYKRDKAARALAASARAIDLTRHKKKRETVEWAEDRDWGAYFKANRPELYYGLTLPELAQRIEWKRDEEVRHAQRDLDQAKGNARTSAAQTLQSFSRRIPRDHTTKSERADAVAHLFKRSTTTPFGKFPPYMNRFVEDMLAEDPKLVPKIKNALYRPIRPVPTPADKPGRKRKLDDDNGDPPPAPKMGRVQAEHPPASKPPRKSLPSDVVGTGLRKPRAKKISSRPWTAVL